MKSSDYGTSGGIKLTDELIERLAQEEETLNSKLLKKGYWPEIAERQREECPCSCHSCCVPLDSWCEDCKDNHE